MSFIEFTATSNLATIKHLKKRDFQRRSQEVVVKAYLPLDHIAVKPGNESMLAAGSWCPNKNELATIRSNIQRNSRRLRSIISAREFVEIFGEAKPHPDGEQQNVFGRDDELKVAPKGIAKDHKCVLVLIEYQSDMNIVFRDIDLLKCRSFAVAHRFTDSEVLALDFKEKLAVIAKIVQPLVHCLNDMMTVTAGDDDSDDDEEAAS
jgi:uncharacterized protein (DUF2461 family)